MKKTKILLGTLACTAITPVIPMAATGCAKQAEDNSVTVAITKDDNVTKAESSKATLNTAFSVSCECKDGFELDLDATKVAVGNKLLTIDVDYIIYYTTIIVSSKAVTDKNVSVDIKSKEVSSFEPTIITDEHVKASAPKAELNKAFYITCALDEGYEIDKTNTKITVDGSELVLDTDYVIYENIIIVASWAITSKDVKIDIKSKTISIYFTVSLYANEGKFESGLNTLTFVNVKKGTKIKDIEGYAEPKISDGSQTFIKWIDDNGNDVSKEQIVTNNMIIGAVYKEIAQPSKKDLSLDNWATVAAQSKTAVLFSNTYLETSFTSNQEDDAKTAILAAIADYAKNPETATHKLTKTMKINLGAVNTEVTVRLIDVGKDEAASAQITKTIFTWEFVDTIDLGNYSYEASSIWYQEDPDTKEVLHSSLLRENCNGLIFTKLPVSVQEAIIPVTKYTRVAEGTLDVYTSTEYLFPLSYGEIGLQAANKIINDTTKQGQYAYYKAIQGESCSRTIKYHLGYNGQKEYTEGFKPILTYPYWTRSPANESKVYFFNPDNVYTSATTALHATYTNAGCAIAPAFCL